MFDDVRIYAVSFYNTPLDKFNRSISLQNCMKVDIVKKALSHISDVLISMEIEKHCDKQINLVSNYLA